MKRKVVNQLVQENLTLNIMVQKQSELIEILLDRLKNQIELEKLNYGK